jgi:hypothetical protein
MARLMLARAMAGLSEGRRQAQQRTDNSSPDKALA